MNTKNVKELYEVPSVEIITFDSLDIITTSPLNYEQSGNENDNVVDWEW